MALVACRYSVGAGPSACPSLANHTDSRAGTGACPYEIAFYSDLCGGQRGDGIKSGVSDGFTSAEIPMARFLREMVSCVCLREMVSTKPVLGFLGLIVIGVLMVLTAFVVVETPPTSIDTPLIPPRLHFCDESNCYCLVSPRSASAR